MHVKVLQKNKFGKNVRPANAAETNETRPTRSLSGPRNYTGTWRHSVDRTGSTICYIVVSITQCNA